MAFGQGGGGGSHSVTVTITATPLVAPPPPPPGGGGGFPVEEGCPEGQSSCVGMITTTGQVLRTIVVTSLDERFRLTIDVDTIARQRDGSPIICIGILKTETLPAPPEGAYIVSVWYDVFPKGATFSPSATLEYIAEPGAIPAGGDGDRLAIAYHDEENEEWVKLDSIADTENNTITTQIDQFYDFAVFGYVTEAPPAAFQVSSLGISPHAVYTGETVDITALVTNTGGQAGSYQVTLKINGVAEVTQEVILGAGSSEQVSFTTTRGIAGTYSVELNGATGTFEVRPKPVIPPSEPFNWWLIILIIVLIALAAETTYVIRKRKEHGGITGVLAAQGKSIASLGPKIGKFASQLPKLASKVATAVRSLFRKISNIRIKW
jgi:hypothetical protein